VLKTLRNWGIKKGLTTLCKKNGADGNRGEKVLGTRDPEISGTEKGWEVKEWALGIDDEREVWTTILELVNPMWKKNGTWLGMAIEKKKEKISVKEWAGPK